MPVEHRSVAPLMGRVDPEDGAGAKRLHHLLMGKADVALLGFACEAGVRRNKGRLGAAEGPEAIRKSLGNLAADSDHVGFVDLGDIVVTGDDLEEGQALLGQHVHEALTTNERVIVLGGGHETAYGSYLGLHQYAPNSRIGIINFDAHLDLRSPGEDGPSSGTPFYQIQNLSPDTFDYMCLGVAAESNTQALFERAAAWGVNVVSDKQLLASPTAADQAIEDLIKRNDVIYLTIDIDLLPFAQAPGVSAPAVRGVPFSTVEYMIEQIIAGVERHGKKLPLADIVEVSPRHDLSGITAKTAATLIRRLLKL